MGNFNLLIIASVLVVAACGGGGGSGGVGVTDSPDVETPPGPVSPPPPLPDDTPLTQYHELSLEVLEFIASNNVDNKFKDHITLPKNMPTMGTASYAGAATIAVGDCTGEGAPHLVGKTKLTADFAKSKISGNISEFSALDNHSTKGSKLDLSGDILGNKVIGKMTGNVGFDNKNFSINDAMNGVFLNDSAGIIIESKGKTKEGADFSAIIVGNKLDAPK